MSQLGAGRIINSRRYHLTECYLGRCTVGSRRFINHVSHCLFQIIADGMFEVTSGPFQTSGPGNNIITRTAGHLTDGKYHRIERTEMTGHDSLQIHHDSRRHHGRIHGQMWLCPMTALTFNVNADFKSGCHAFAGFHGNLAHRQINPNMGPEHAVCFFKPGAKLFHILSTFTAFFSRLEYEIHLAFDFVLQSFQHLGGTQ